MKTLTREEKRELTKKRKRRVVPGPAYWGTADELNYLKKIGLHKVYLTPGLSRIHLLRRYRDSLVHKVFWGDIDKELVMAYLNVEIGK